MNIKSITQLWTEPADSFNGIEYYDFILLFSDGWGNHCIMSQACANRLSQSLGLKVQYSSSHPFNQQELEDSHEIDLLVPDQGIAFTGENHMGDETIEPRIRVTKPNFYSFPGLASIMTGVGSSEEATREWVKSLQP